ncbi:pyridoxal-phosphate dependent enzyme [Streptomyces niveiscabiei]|uniref:PLP-dependent cysteine synthase family protein n=1 Tax=Streptomyces niveiscabiei TaxID=164115 RepID=UPI0029AE2DCE|nr:pyridoxal-phosphate dependent enzyme [Streptomyces niveiscabiei]MDX3383862.1 pyridoxal-phosphate dependent enzyme [Streptomyces niveiscabiei]
MSDTILPTPLLEVLPNTFLKCEFLHPGRSHKARVARALIEDAERRGVIVRGGGTALVERTGGNLGIGLALEARLRGHELVLVTDPGYSRIKKEIAGRLGAKVVDRGISHPDCADNEAAVQSILRAAPGRFHYLNQFGNPANPAAHEQGTGAEILAQLIGRGHGRDTRVTLVSGLGTGATARGVSSALRQWFREVEVVGVEPPDCDLLADRHGEHGLQGFSVGQPAPFFPSGELAAVVPVTDGEVAAAGTRLFEEHRVFVGPSSHANFAAVLKSRPASPGNVLVSFLYDRGEDYE